MERRDAALIATFIAAIAAPKAVEAQTYAAPLETDTPASEYVRWEGVNPQNIISHRMDKTRRDLTVVTTPNAPITVNLGCPPPSLYPGWKLEVPRDYVPGGEDHAEIDETDVVRTGRNGTFAVRLTAPSRQGKVKAKFRCRKYEPGDDGELDTEDDVPEGDAEALSLNIVSQGIKDGRPVPFPVGSGNVGFAPSNSGEREGSADRRPFRAAVGGVSSWPMAGGMPRPGVFTEFGIDVLGDEKWLDDLIVGLRYRLSQGLERAIVDRRSGTGERVNVKATGHGMFATATAEKRAGNAVRFALGAGAGGVHLEKSDTDIGGTVPPRTDPAAEIHGGISVGGESVQVGAGADAVFTRNGGAAVGLNGQLTVRF